MKRAFFALIATLVIIVSTSSYLHSNQKNLDDKFSLISLANESFEKKDHYDAIKKYDRIITDNFSSAEIIVNRAISYAETGNFNKAFKDLETARKADPKYIKSYLAKSLIYHYKLNDSKKALTIIKDTIDKFPNESAPHCLAGYIYDNIKDHSSAKYHYSKAIDIGNIKSMQPYLERGNIYYKIGEYDKAISDYGKYIETNPNDYTGYYRRALAFQRLNNKYDEACRDYQKALELNSNEIEIYVNFGKLHTAYSNDDSLPKIYYNKASKLTPRNNYEYKLRSQLHDKFEDQVSDINKVINTDPGDPEAYLIRGNIYLQKGFEYYNLSNKNYEKFLELSPNFLKDFSNRAYFSNVYKKWAEQFQLKEDYRTAIKIFKKSLNFFPLNDDAYYKTGFSYYKLGDTSEAILNCRYALTINPKNHTAKQLYLHLNEK